MPTQPVLVLGGGIAGISAAISLAQRGVQVTLVEHEPRLGGNASTVCCKAVNGRCQQCGGCLFSSRMQAIIGQARVTIHTASSVQEFLADDHGYTYLLKTPDADIRQYACAVIVATGFDHIDARTKGPYGYGILPMVISGEELERRLKLDGQGAFDSADPREVAFIQCVGSRDEHAGRGWCSQVCCRYGVRLARLLKSRSPRTNVTVFKMDIQANGRDFDAYSASQRENIQYVAGLPAVIRRSQGNSTRAEFLFDDIMAGQFRRQEFDLVVLATGMQPRRDSAQLADLLGIGRDRYGFLAAGDDTVSLGLPGIFAAGCCQAPRSIAESIAHAETAAEACYRYLLRLRG